MLIFQVALDDGLGIYINLGIWVQNFSLVIFFL